jgi:hypothetical protein
MKLYWVKIAVGALMIFGVGFGVLSGVRAAKRRVVEVAQTNRDVTIPLPFVPFTFEGAERGKLRRITFHRSEPKRLSGVDLTVRLSDAGLVDRLRGCSLTLDNPSKIDRSTTFRCADAKNDTTLEQFGTVAVETEQDGDPVRLALMLPHAAIQELQGKGAAHAKQLEADRFRELGDSMRVLGERMGKNLTEEQRSDIESAMDDLRGEMEDLQSEISDRAKDPAEKASESVKADIGAGGVKVEVTPAPPKPPMVKPAHSPPGGPKGRF